MKFPALPTVIPSCSVVLHEYQSIRVHLRNETAALTGLSGHPVLINLTQLRELDRAVRTILILMVTCLF
jgi:hypothetical protein